MKRAYDSSYQIYPYFQLESDDLLVFGLGTCKPRNKTDLGDKITLKIFPAKTNLDIVVPDAEQNLVIEVLPLGLVVGAGCQLTQTLTNLGK